MADIDTAPINIDTSPLIVTSLEEFKKALCGVKITYLFLDRRNGILTYGKSGQEIAIPSARLSHYDTENTRLAEEILRYIGIPDGLIEKIRRKSVGDRGRHYLWMPAWPIPVTFLDRVLGRRRQEWQLLVIDKL